MKKRTTLYWLLPAVVGLALIVVAVLLSSMSPGGRVVPSAQAIAPSGCELKVEKDFQSVDGNGIIFRRLSPSGATATPRPENEIEFTIAVTNLGGDTQQDCTGLEVVDQLPEGLTCEDAGVIEAPAGFQVEGGCDNQGTGFSALLGQGGEQATFISGDTLASGEEVVLGLIARADNNDCVTNRACAVGGLTAGNSNMPLADGTCDEVRTCEPRHPRTPTPTVTNTPIPPTATPYVPRPTATPKPLATLVPPKTGTGSESGIPWLAVGLGLGGVCLLLVSGAALAKKRIR